jgi:hypothetical integral membrane protein (TIGR02206 family)
LGDFRPFSATHAAVLLLFAAATALLIRYGRRRRGTAALLRLERRLGGALLLLWVVGNGWWLLPPRFDPARSLPLQVCDVTSLAAAVVLIAPVRFARAVLYFWGIALSIQALITPDLGGGVTTAAFWLFWIAHASAVAIAVYDVAARGFRPTWRDYLVAAGAAAAYLVVVLAINLAFGFNYGYVGRATPGQPSLIDFLGPWPERVVVIAALVAAVMALLVLPWELARRARAGAPSAKVRPWV